MNFTDSTGLTLSSRGSVVTYTDRQNAVHTMWLSEVGASEFATSVFPRLIYIKDMLYCLINKRSIEGEEAKKDLFQSDQQGQYEQKYVFGRDEPDFK